MHTLSISPEDTNVKAHVLPKSLKVSNLKSSEPQPVSASTNYLSLAPRSTPIDGRHFENDGPGHLANAGARHDNDFVRIRNIHILPTADEILSQRGPYMPFKPFNQPHFLPRGPERLIDTLFRHLRYENVEGLKDCVYVAAQKLLTISSHGSDYEPCEDTPNGNRCYLFWEAEFEELLFHDRQGLMVRISYLCPKKLRGRKIFNSGRFENGMVVALVGLDNEGNELSVVFFEAYLSQSTDSMVSRGGKGVRAAVQLRFAQPENIDDLRRTVRYSQGLASGRFVLVDFPRRLLNGFYPVLNRLQQLQRSDLAFTRYYAPRRESEENVGLLPPSYSILEGAVIDFKNPSQDAICRGKPLRDLIADKSEFLQFLKEGTGLDEGQAIAFVEAMNRELALVQGPPGTGKTYLGSTLVQAILSAVGSSQTPILVVCLTNHALDAFLKELLEKGVRKIARIGGGSREDWTKKYNLKSLVSSTKLRQIERHTRAKEYGAAKDLAIDGSDICEATNAPNKLGWYTVSKHLRDNYKDVYRQFMLAARTDDPLQSMGIHKRIGGFPYALWSSGGDLEVLAESVSGDFAMFLGRNSIEGNDRQIDLGIFYHVLRDVLSQMRQNSCDAMENIWMLSHRERCELMAKWASEIDHEATAKDIVNIHLQHQAAVSRLRLVREEIEARCLSMQEVVGLTTTACASKWSLLQRLRLRVVICEEAGEVMEAHSLCTLLPSVEHAIFIGDPLQLRPQLVEQSLSLETKTGSLYRLDESLFERLTNSKSGIKTLPHSILSVQRRMHPDISQIAKSTLYPRLLDHPSTKLHSAVGGLRDRTYWFDHRIPEDQCFGFSSATKSFSNRFEVEMVSGLVQYLVQSNVYGLGDIAVLTPYSGQLAQLIQSLHRSCSLWLSESDKEALLEGFLTDKELESPGPVDLDMAGMLRISTIDNFQGEEAKVVILTTVRSNPECRPGFLKTINRINVACSRARDGFYIFGNSQSLQIVPMWNDIIQLFRSQNRLGMTLKIRSCSQNLSHDPGYFPVQQPEDFAKIPPCQARCNQLLPCGHICTQSCHPLELHASSIMKCEAKCNKVHETCKHPCTKACWEPCGSCIASSSKRSLRCRHDIMIPCAEQKSNIPPLCQIVVEELTLRCGHKFLVICGFRDQEPLCSEACDFILDCGHRCVGVCETCHKTGHAPCAQKCGKKLGCHHNCDAGCHENESCPPCQQPCQERCSHGRCRGKCNEPCQPCLRVTNTSECCSNNGLYICALDVIINRNPQKLTSTVDCLIMNVGRKYHMLGKRLQHSDIMLRETSKLFRSQIRPSPLSAGHNRRVIQERGSGIAEVQAHVLEIKEQLVIPLEADLRHLQEQLQIPKTNSPFGLRFVLLFYRCRYTSLVDLLKTSEFLLTLDDPSCQCRILAESIRRTVIIHSNRNTSSLNNSIIECESKSLNTLEVETRLLQLGFYSLAKRAVKLNCARGRDIADEARGFSGDVPDDTAIRENFSGLGPFKLDLDLTIQRMATLCRRYPKSAGLYVKLVDSTKHAIYSNHKLPYLFPAETGSVERAWGSPECSKLVKCVNHHVYPADSFDDCPECGKEVVGSDEVNYEQFLSETEFLSLMRTQNHTE
ncbi:uncharacterized protein BDCG_16275 [Blastomyces dermatitidis ER-3]|uniref:NF-X1-type domain-containing protein n=1 Tax=Ajellomyces dermatitidis (strain ER-3 / ATCC MYA-2586) TaxID=559297 RepID=A0ABX2VR40_AJEDR|nr:uncharacterized protein BDCG_16275 [Blastomyces dermatitidis ER-3]OAS99706.1 hypothetical protein BDCG_16275 [Blastomyces dermatitidis ER-3]